MNALALVLVILLAGCTLTVRHEFGEGAPPPPVVGKAPALPLATPVPPRVTAPPMPRQPREGPAQTIILEVVQGATAYDIEYSTDGGTTWMKLATIPASSCSASTCEYPVTPGQGRTLYRWAAVTGTTRSLRTDAGVYLCVGLPDCPVAPSGVGVR